MATIKSKATANAAVKASGLVKALKCTVSKDELAARIKGVCDTSATLQDDIHAVAVDIMLHVYEHADITFPQALVDGLGMGIRRVALVEWFKMAGMKVSATEGKFNGFNREKMVDKWEFVKANKWYTMKPERPFAGFDLQAELERLLAKAEKASAKNASTPEDQRAEDYKFNLDAAKLAALRAMVQPATGAIN